MAEDTDPDDEAPADGLHYVASADEVAPGERVLIDVRGREIGVFNLDGEFAAVANYCVHQGGPIAEGTLTGGTLRANEALEVVYDESSRCLHCPWHGWEFDVQTGEHTAPTRHRVPTYDVVVRDGGLYLRIG